jgi:hypothetical protein
MQDFVGTWAWSGTNPMTVVMTPTSATFSGDGAMAFGATGSFCVASLYKDPSMDHYELTLTPNAGVPAPDMCLVATIAPLAQPAPLMTIAVGTGSGSLDCLAAVPSASSGSASVVKLAKLIPPDPDAATPSAYIAVVVIMVVAMIGSSMYNRHAIQELAGGKKHLKLAEL